MRQLQQVGYTFEYMDDIVTDFQFLAGIRIDPFDDDFDEMNSRQFFGHVRRLPYLKGSVRQRMINQAEREEKEREEKIEEMNKSLNGSSGMPNWAAIANRKRELDQETDRDN